MEMIVIVIVCITLIVCGGMMMAQGFLSSADSVAVSVEKITTTKGEVIRTDLSLLSARQTGIDNIGVTLRNSGQIKLASFNKWDAIVQYYDSNQTYFTKWLPYTEGTLGDNEWQKTGIYLDAGDNTPEVFEPGILNPGEEMMIKVKLNPPPRDGTTVNTIIVTPNGIRDSISFVY
jgi:hypothetical protein